MVRVPGIPPVQRHLRQRARGTGVQAVTKCCHAMRHLCCTCRDDAGAKPRRCPAADAESRPRRCPAADAAERTSNGQRAARGPAFVRQVASPLAGARTLLGDRGADFRHRPLAQGSIPARAGQLPEPTIPIRINPSDHRKISCDSVPLTAELGMLCLLSGCFMMTWPRAWDGETRCLGEPPG